MALMFPTHVAMPPLSWTEYIWISEITPTNESFLTTVFEHKKAVERGCELLHRMPSSVASIVHDERERTQAQPTQAVQEENR